MTKSEPITCGICNEQSQQAKKVEWLTGFPAPICFRCFCVWYDENLIDVDEIRRRRGVIPVNESTGGSPKRQTPYEASGREGGSEIITDEGLDNMWYSEVRPLIKELENREYRSNHIDRAASILEVIERYDNVVDQFENTIRMYREGIINEDSDG
jgi:hypothetical protein